MPLMLRLVLQWPEDRFRTLSGGVPESASVEPYMCSGGGASSRVLEVEADFSAEKLLSQPVPTSGDRPASVEEVCWDMMVMLDAWPRYREHAMNPSILP